jgi:outer membrane murein-binding lipoprotein Lpp
MTTFSTVEEFLEILRRQPELLEAARRLIVQDDLLALPVVLADFIEATNRNFGLVHQRLERLENDVAVLKEDVTVLKEDVTVLKEDVTVLKEDVTVLKEDVTVLKEDVKELKADVKELKADVKELKADVKELKGDVATLKTGQNRMQGQLDNLIGTDYERKVARRIRRTADRNLSIQNAQLVQSVTITDNPFITNLSDAAVGNGIITTNQADELEDADVVVKGSDSDGDEAYAVAELSVTIHHDDIDRALDRAKILQQATDKASVPAVIGADISDENREYARSLDVAVIILHQ